MAGNYEKSIYNQLMDVMARLDAVEQDLHTEKIEHKEDVDRLNAKIDGLTQENQLLKDDNARLKASSITTVPIAHSRLLQTRRAENRRILTTEDKNQPEGRWAERTQRHDTDKSRGGVAAGFRQIKSKIGIFSTEVERYTCM